jgi:hypothetical protein
MKPWIYFLILIIQGAAFELKAQDPEVQARGIEGANVYISLAAGAQMSGIKNEDFISHNIAPLMTVSAGKWFTPLLALQLGYRGNYYNTISDDKKHYYNYFFGETVFSLNKLVNPKKQLSKFGILFHAGSGYFYNHDYDRPNICAHFGLSADYKLTEWLSTFINLSAIMGWDIYQGDEDILPGVLFGLSYQIH